MTSKQYKERFKKGRKCLQETHDTSIGKKWLHGVVISVAQHSQNVKVNSGLVIHHQFDQIPERSTE